MLGAVRMVPWEGTAAGDSSETIMTWINFFQTQVLKEDLDYLHSDPKLFTLIKFSFLTHTKDPAG